MLKVTRSRRVYVYGTASLPWTWCTCSVWLLRIEGSNSDYIEWRVQMHIFPKMLARLNFLMMHPLKVLSVVKVQYYFSNLQWYLKNSYEIGLLMNSGLIFTVTPKKKSAKEVQEIKNDDGSFPRQNFVICIQRFLPY